LFQSYQLKYGYSTIIGEIIYQGRKLSLESKK
jgi:hypothetical protein